VELTLTLTVTLTVILTLTLTLTLNLTLTLTSRQKAHIGGAVSRLRVYMAKSSALKSEREIWGRCRGDVGEMWGRYRGDIGGI